MPIQRRFKRSATVTVVPQPQKGSRTTSPSLAGGFNDAFQQGFGFLGGVAQAFGSLCGDRRNVGPYILEYRSLSFIKINL